jgi:hypothetical protein
MNICFYASHNYLQTWAKLFVISIPEEILCEDGVELDLVGLEQLQPVLARHQLIFQSIITKSYRNGILKVL